MDRYRLKYDDLTGDIDLVVCKDGELIKYVDYHVSDERLRKENEWLLQKAIYDYHSRRNPQPPAGEAEENILKDMQQALKED